MPVFYYVNRTPEREALLQQSIGGLQQLFTRVLAEDNMIAVDKTMGFLRDAPFMKAYNDQVTNNQEASLIWRLHTLSWAAKQCLGIPGDFVEAGVFKGFCSAVLAQYLEFNTVDKSWYLYDTFEGVEGLQRYGEDPDLANKVRQRFSAYENIHVVQGFVPDSFAEAAPEQVAFLHIDMNNAPAEIATLEQFYDRLSPGGMIVFDDYGWAGYQAQKDAEDVFIQERGGSILELPTGQGLFVKPPSA